MTFEFTLFLMAFLASHAIPMAPKLRTRLIDGLGRKTYFAGYSLASMGLLLWLFSAAARAPYPPLWPALRSAPFWGMPLVFWLIAEGLIRPNPLSLGRPGPGPHGLSRFTRPPPAAGIGCLDRAAYPRKSRPISCSALRPARRVLRAFHGAHRPAQKNASWVPNGTVWPKAAHGLTPLA